jgi:hypothetical protein
MTTCPGRNGPEWASADELIAGGCLDQPLRQAESLKRPALVEGCRDQHTGVTERPFYEGALAGAWTLTSHFAWVCSCMKKHGHAWTQLVSVRAMRFRRT